MGAPFTAERMSLAIRQASMQRELRLPAITPNKLQEVQENA